MAELVRSISLVWATVSDLPVSFDPGATLLFLLLPAFL